MLVVDGKPVEWQSLCECCAAEMFHQTIWTMNGRAREAVAPGMVTIIRAVDKTVELYAGDKPLGTMPWNSDRQPTLASTAAKLHGKWTLVRRDVMVRVAAISYWRPDKCGAHLLVDGVAIKASRRRWPDVKRLLFP